MPKPSSRLLIDPMDAIENACSSTVVLLNHWIRAVILLNPKLWMSNHGIEYCTWQPSYKRCLMVRQQGNLCLHGRNQGASGNDKKN
jgi:hypothetical protein